MGTDTHAAGRAAPDTSSSGRAPRARRLATGLAAALLGVGALGAAAISGTPGDAARPWLAGPAGSAPASPIPTRVGEAVPAGSVRAAVQHLRAARLERPLQVLVTNDDGIGAAGIDALVEGLRRLPDVELTLVAPLTNQSGTGDTVTDTPIRVSAGRTASGFRGRAINGRPADTVLWAVKAGRVPRPDLVVSGINFGQNFGDAVTLSGTVGAATTAARLGIPSIAVSQGIPATDYQGAADIVTAWVAWAAPGLVERRPSSRIKTVVNINVPNCPSVRGVVIVPVGRLRTLTGYTGGPPEFTPTFSDRGYGDYDCGSGATRATDDVDAFNKGLVGVTLLRPLMSDR